MHLVHLHGAASPRSETAALSTERARSPAHSLRKHTESTDRNQQVRTKHESHNSNTKGEAQRPLGAAKSAPHESSSARRQSICPFGHFIFKVTRRRWPTLVITTSLYQCGDTGIASTSRGIAPASRAEPDLAPENP